MGRVRTSVAGHIDKDRDATVRLVAWFVHEFDAVVFSRTASRRIANSETTTSWPAPLSQSVGIRSVS
jgi:hypothetical protein